MGTLAKLNRCFGLKRFSSLVGFVCCCIQPIGALKADYGPEERPEKRPENTPAKRSEKKLVLIHSYDETFRFTGLEDMGIVKAVDRYGSPEHWTITRFYLDSKRRPEPAHIRQNAEEVKRALLKLKPDAIILTDDDAFSTLYLFLRSLKIPISFAGINGRLEDYGYRNGDRNVSGTLESYNIPAAVKVAMKLRPTADSVLITSEPDLTGRALLSDFKTQILNDDALQKAHLKVETSIGTQYEQLQNRLRRVDPDKTIVILAAYFTQRDRNGRYISREEANHWVMENTRFIDIGHVSFQMAEGRLLGFGFSAEEMGYYAARILFNSIHSGEDLGLIPVRQQLPLQLVVNFERAKRLDLQFPFELLSYVQDSQRMYEGTELAP